MGEGGIRGLLTGSRSGNLLIMVDSRLGTSIPITVLLATKYLTTTLVPPPRRQWLWPPSASIVVVAAPVLQITSTPPAAYKMFTT
jgi:cobalamin synthase